MQQQKPMPIGIIILGLVFFGMASWWKSALGGGGANLFYIGFFQFIGAMAVLGGVIELGRQAKRKATRAGVRGGPTSGVHGTADFASARECYDAGLMDPNGLYLGLLGKDNAPIFYTGKAHLLTVAPARQGKGINTVIPNLLHWQGSVLVTDPKGELAAVTARHRRETFGQEVSVLNPWGLHGLPQHTYNPLQVLLDAANDARLVGEISDEARNIAFQLVPEIEDKRNQWVRNGARSILIGLMLHLATRGDPGSCNLVELWRILNSAKLLRETAAAMKGSQMLAGMIAHMGDTLVEDLASSTEGFRNCLSTAQEAVTIFDPVGPLGRAVCGSDVAFRKLKEGRASVYLVIPQDRIESHGAWLGIVTRQAIRAVTRSAGDTQVLFLLDEFANMGKLAGLAESLTGLPGLGVRIWAIVQELADIKRVYGEHTHETLLSQAEVKQFFAVTNHNLAKILSEAMGQRTVRTTTYNMGRTEDEDVGENLGETGEPLMRPDEIRQMGEQEQLLFIKNLKPIRAKRVPFWLIAPWTEQADKNPTVAGDTPRVKPLVTVRYRKKGGQGR